MDSESKEVAKISGYLEKKGRKKMMSCYKKYWFVLEGKLLLYYRSKEEYEAISPCKGSINLGPTCNVKPCCLRVGVFQIVSRTTTITLRAESREEQHKWMQAVMTALNQHTAPTRLSHFRYSLGELSPEPKRPLERQNTMPQRLGRAKNGTGIIEKLQKREIQSNGGCPEQIKSKSTSYDDQTKIDSICEDSVFSDNGKYEISCKKISISDCESIDCSFDSAYERIPSRESLERLNNESTPKKSSKIRPGSLFNRCSKPTERKPRPNSITICDKTTYCDDENCSFNSNSCSSNENNCPFTPNDFFFNPNKTLEEYISINNEPRYEEIDCNKNFQNGGPQKFNDDAFLEKSGRNPKNRLVIGSCESLNEEKSSSRRFKGFGRNKLVKSKSEEKTPNLKKSESFLQRVWKKKCKNKKKTTEMDKNSSIEKIAEHDLILPPLNILQDVLDSEKNREDEVFLRQRTMANEIKEERNYENLDSFREKSGIPALNHKPTLTGPPLPPRGQRANKRLSILPHDVPKIRHSLDNVVDNECRNGNTSLEKIMHDIEVKLDTTSVDRVKENDYNVEDEIPEKETNTPQKGKVKVKELIKRFSSEPEELKEDTSVELRHRKDSKTNVQKFTIERDSTELNTLLDELSKITTAPIMTPGVTSSLVNPDISDEELIKLIPIRKRRTSDPDYDVPRSYQSLTNLPTKTEDCDLRGTRFFGPILRPFDIHSMEKEPPSPDHTSQCPSMTPDSLETEQCFGKPHKIEDGDLPISYHSHDYLSLTQSHHKIEYLSHHKVEEDSTHSHYENLHRMKYEKEILKNHYDSIVVNKSIGNQSNDIMFADSLEMYPPVGSTDF